MITDKRLFPNYVNVHIYPLNDEREVTPQDIKDLGFDPDLCDICCADCLKVEQHEEELK